MPCASVELCAGGGGQALGLERAGFHPCAVVECDRHCCTTLRSNRPHWNILQLEIGHFRAEDHKGVDLLSAGLPFPGRPGQATGAKIDLLPAALRVAETIRPRALLFENSAGLASPKFEPYRRDLLARLAALGYEPDWRILQAGDYGVPQFRRRFVLVALRPRDAKFHRWPAPRTKPVLVGETLADLMGEQGWPGAPRWTARRACGVAPALVGGSPKRGGPDLGPAHAKRQWRQLGIDGSALADQAPDARFAPDGFPRLTLRMAARLQGFPDSWTFCGGKTAAYRQIGHAFPPPAAEAIGLAIRSALEHRRPADGESPAAVQGKLFP